MPDPERDLLAARDQKLDLSSKIGKTQVVNQNGSLADQPGYYCAVCECIIRDSTNYLDHINGKRRKIFNLFNQLSL